VIYGFPGTYDVILTSSNFDGSDTKVKSDYITVTDISFPPVSNFIVSATDIIEGTTVQFTDVSANEPLNWNWTFEGGSPATSTDQNPSVTYTTPGIFDVTLTTSNFDGSDTEVKSDFITVSGELLIPSADFTSNVTEIFAGESIQFTDISTNNPTQWIWSFPGGSPSSSSLQNPIVQYLTPGEYDVVLIASNTVGNDVETKSLLITVNETPVVIPDFSANETEVEVGGIVEFTDESLNNPTSWVWSFPGGVPSTSSLENPIVVYPEAGCYNVTLVVSNQFGNEQITKECYINVGTTNTNNLTSVGSALLYPNPVSTNNRLYCDLEIIESSLLNIYVLDNRGAVVKKILSHKPKIGLSQLSFSTELLPSGNHNLLIMDMSSKKYRNEKFIVN